MILASGIYFFGKIKIIFDCKKCHYHTGNDKGSSNYNKGLSLLLYWKWQLLLSNKDSLEIGYKN